MARDVRCPGSFTEGEPYTLKCGKRRMTEQCRHCKKRVALVTCHGLPGRPRRLGEHWISSDQAAVIEASAHQREE